MGYTQLLGNEFSQPAVKKFVRVRRVLVALGALFCGVVLLSAVTSMPALSQQKTPPALGGDFELVDTNGQAFKLISLRGKVVLIYFGYTGCPDACPTDLLLFRDVLTRLGNKKDLVQPVFISVDPARDTPRHLAAYASTFSPAILALTGSERKLRQVAKAYGSYFDYIGRTPGSTTYTVDHSVNIYVVNGQGRLVSVIPYGTPAEEVVRRIEGVLDQSSGPTATKSLA